MSADFLSASTVVLAVVTVAILAGMAAMIYQAVISIRHELEDWFTRMAFLLLLVGVLTGFGYGYVLILRALLGDFGGS